MGNLREIIYWINELSKLHNSVQDNKKELIAYIENIIKIKTDFISLLYQDSLYPNDIIYCINEFFPDESIQEVIITKDLKVYYKNNPDIVYTLPAKELHLYKLNNKTYNIEKLQLN